MAEAAAIGIQPREFLRCTPRQLYAAFKGANLAALRERQRSLWQAWITANFQRGKRLPPLLPMLKDLERTPDMTDKQIRVTITGMAQAMGAKVIYKKRGEP